MKQILDVYMKLRQNHPILDRIKIIIVLLFLLFFLLGLARYLDERNSNQKISTIENFLRTALEPVGSTMYIWGGGWDEEDSTSGSGSTRIGVSPKWKSFAEQQDKTYDFNQHRYEREQGLDCSGFVGWVVYNTFESKSGEEGYVTTSTDMAENFAERGWGTFVENPKEFLPGDIVSMDGHVWISLGTCADGSVLLVHSSPPGVSICGTQIEEGRESIAVALAAEYMHQYHPKWQAMYPNRAVSRNYLQNVSVMRWNEATMEDVKEMKQMRGEEVAEKILGIN